MKPERSLLLVLLASFVMACSSSYDDNPPEYSVIEVSPEDASEYWEPMRTVNPYYPVEAVRRRQAGCVDLQFVIDPDGNPEYVEVVRGYPAGIFDHAALTTFKQWRWEPSPSNSERQAIRTSMQMTFMFQEAGNLPQVERVCGDIIFGSSVTQPSPSS